MSTRVDPRKIVTVPFPDLLAILPSDTYVFDHGPEALELTLRIVERRKLFNGVEVMAVNLGLLAFDFADGPLGGFRRLKSTGYGEISQAVRDNEAAMLRLQAQRLRVAVFVSACLYGVHAVRHHSTVRGAWFPSLDDVFSCAVLTPELIGLAPFDMDRLLVKMRARREALNARKLSGSSISRATLGEGLDLADRLLGAARTYVAADPVTLIVLTYQAMVLHGLQHPGASIAIAAVVIESAIAELLYGLGLVEGVAPRLTPPQTAPAPMSRRRLKTLGFNGMVGELRSVGVLNAYLVQRIEAVRQARNAFMHDAQEPGPSRSGDALTAVRDVLRLCTGESGFELNTGFAYRS